jgi:hypothetical protein
VLRVLAVIALAAMPISAIAQPTDTPPANTVRSDDTADDQQCASYGAKVGSDVYVQCRLKLAELRQEKQTDKSRSLRCRTVYFAGIAKTRCK